MNRKLVIYIIIFSLFFYHLVNKRFLQIIRYENISGNRTIKGDSTFDEFYEKNPLEGEIGKKIQRVLVCSKAAEDKYAPQSSEKNTDPGPFFKELDGFFASFKDISFKEIKDYEWPEKRSSNTIFRRFRKVSAFILDLMFEKSKYKSVQKKIDSLDPYMVIENLFKCSSIIEKAHTGLISSILVRAKDESILKAVNRLLIEKRFTAEDNKRLIRLIDSRRNCSFTFEESVEREVNYTLSVFRRTDKYFISMLFINLFHGNAEKQYLSLVEDFKNGAEKEALFSSLKKYNILVQLSFPNFWKVKANLSKLDDKIKSFKESLKNNAILNRSEGFDVYEKDSHRGIDSHLF